MTPFWIGVLAGAAAAVIISAIGALFTAAILAGAAIAEDDTGEWNVLDEASYRAELRKEHR